MLHITLGFLDEVYCEIRSSMPSRRTFFEQVRTLLQVMPFDSWEHFMIFMLDGQEKYHEKYKTLNWELLRGYVRSTVRLWNRCAPYSVDSILTESIL